MSFVISPVVTVVIPVYNAEAFLAPTLLSVFRQTYPHFDVVVVDDGSTDGSVALVKRLSEQYGFAERVQVVSKPNEGVAKARNEGFWYANGEYVAFLDADDRWFPGKLQADVDTINRHDNKICLVYSGVYTVDAKGHLTGIRKYPKASGDAAQTVLTNNLMIPSSALMHRQVMTALGGFPVDTYHEDRVFFVRACTRFPAYATGQRDVVYQEALTGRLRRILMDYETALESEFSVIRSLEGDLSPEAFEQLQQFHVRSLFNRFLRYNLLDSARKYAPELPEGVLDQDLKGLISKISLQTNINFLYICQIIVHFLTGVLLHPFWLLKSRNLSSENVKC